MLRSIGGAFVQKAVEVNFAVQDHLVHAHQTMTKIVDSAIHAPTRYCVVCNRSCLFHQFTFVGPKLRDESTNANDDPIDSPEDEENPSDNTTQNTNNNNEIENDTSPVKLPTIEELSDRSQIHVCPSCYFEGKIPIGSYHDEYEEHGRASSVSCGLCDAVCNTHYFTSQTAIGVKAGTLEKSEVRILCPLCQGRLSTSFDELPPNFQEERALWPTVTTGSLTDFQERGEQKVTSPKVIMSFGSAGGMYDKMHGMINFVRNALRWDQQEIWIDREQIWRHPDWQQKYQDTLRETPVIIFMLSMAWVNSKYCLQELEWWKNLPNKQQPTAIICVMEHEVLATKAFRNIVKILLTNISFEDIVTLKYDKVVDLSVMGGKHKLALMLDLMFPEMEKFVEQGKYLVKKGMQGSATGIHKTRHFVRRTLSAASQSVVVQKN